MISYNAKNPDNVMMVYTDTIYDYTFIITYNNDKITIINSNFEDIIDTSTFTEKDFIDYKSVLSNEFMAKFNYQYALNNKIPEELRVKFINAIKEKLI